MKRLIFFVVVALLVTTAAFAQQNKLTGKPNCEDCSHFPYTPSGCNYSNCLVQVLATATKEDLLNYFALPDNICDKILFLRNRGVRSMQDYRAELEGYEYSTLLHAYSNYVTLRTPAVAMH